MILYGVYYTNLLEAVVPGESCVYKAVIIGNNFRKLCDINRLRY